MDKNNKLLRGAFLEYLNYGFGATQNIIMGGSTMDLMFDGDKRETRSYEVKIVYSSTAGQVSLTRNLNINIPSSSSNSHSMTFDSGKYSGQSMSIDQLSSAMSYKSSPLESAISGMINAQLGNPMGGLLTMSIYDMATGNTARVKERIASFAISQTMGTVRDVVASKVVSALNITSPITASILSLGVGAIVGELFERAVGLDSSFGFGGEYQGKDAYGRSVYEEEMSIGQVLENTVSDIMSSLGISGYSSYTEFNDMTFSNGSYINNGLIGTLASGFDDSLGDWNSTTFESPSGDYTTSFTSNNFGLSTVTRQDGVTSYFEQNITEEGIMSLSQYSNPSDIGGGRFSGTNDINSTYSGNDATARDFESDFGSDFSGQSSSSSTESGRHCCTVLVKRRVWRMHKLKDLGIWDKKQNIVWRTGYQIGGKIVANYYDKDNKIEDYTKMMDAFYDTHILNKPRTIHTYRAYLRIYPMVYITGIYNLLKNSILDFFKKIVYNSKIRKK